MVPGMCYFFIEHRYRTDTGMEQDRRMGKNVPDFFC